MESRQQLEGLLPGPSALTNYFVLPPRYHAFPHSVAIGTGRPKRQSEEFYFLKQSEFVLIGRTEWAVAETGVRRTEVVSVCRTRRPRVEGGRRMEAVAAGRLRGSRYKLDYAPRRRRVRFPRTPPAAPSSEKS